MKERQQNRTNVRTGVVLLALVVMSIALAYRLWQHVQSPLALGVHTIRPDDRAMKQAHDLGAEYIVQVFSWREIEPTRGEFHWEYTDWIVRAAEFYGLRVIARLDQSPGWAVSDPTASNAPPTRTADYAEWAGRVAQRYRGRVHAYIIWNEPNLAREWGNEAPDPVGYAALLQAAAAQIRVGDPRATILSAGLAPTNERSQVALDDREYLRALYAAGARDNFDALAAHPYGFSYSPDDPRGEHAGLNYARLQDLREIMIANGDADKPVWITEFGYATERVQDQHTTPVSEEQQAQFTTRAVQIARERWPWVHVFTVWNLAQERLSADDHAAYSLVRADGSLKPAYGAIQNLYRDSAVDIALVRAQTAFSPAPLPTSFPILTRDARVHLGDSEYPSPWVPLYRTRNPSTEWVGEFYLRDSDLGSAGRARDWTLTLELMQANDLDTRVLVNDQPIRPPFLPTGDFTSVWVTAHFKLPAAHLHVGHNTVTLRDGKLFPVFQQAGFTWDDLQLRNVILWPP